MYMRTNPKPERIHIANYDTDRTVNIVWTSDTTHTTGTGGACYDFYFFSEYSKNHKGGI
jgi:hypothetical protein